MNKNIKKPADVVFKECLTEHGEHVLGSMLPHAIDGLKPVQRRILTCHSSGDTDKASKVVGKVLDWHPHGDSSIAGAIIKLAQPHKSLILTMVSPSNKGTYNGDEAAAPRYFDVGISPLAKFAYFQDMDHSVFVKVPNETGNGTYESKYLVPKIPLAVSIASAGIAFGYSSEPSNLSFSDMLNLATGYIKLLNNGKGPKTKKPYYKKLARYLVPEFTMKQHIRNRKQLLKAYTEGVFDVPIVLDGELELSTNNLIIRTLPYGTYPRDVVSKIGKELVTPSSNVINEHFSRIEDYSTEPNRCNLILTLKRNVNIFDALEAFKKSINGTRKWTPRNLFVVPSGQVATFNPVEMVQAWYVQRIRFLKAELSKAQHSVIKQMRVLEALIKIGDRIKEVVALLLDMKSSEAAIPVLCKQFGLTRTQAMAILDFKLANIPKRNHKELTAKYEKLNASLFVIQRKFLNPAKVVLEDIAIVKSKFKKLDVVNSYNIKFIGVVVCENGYVQFENKEELVRLATELSNITNILLYGDATHRTAYVGGKLLDESLVDLPKEMRSRGFCVGLSPYHNTIVLSKTGMLGISTKFSPIKDKYKYLRVAKRDTVIALVGKSKRVVKLEDACSLTPNSLDNHGNPTIKAKVFGIGALGNPTDDLECWVVYSNETNRIVLHRWDGKDITNIIGRSVILGLYPVDQPICIPIPKSITSTTIKQLVISDPDKLNKDTHTVYLGHKVHNLPGGKLHHDLLLG